MTKILRNRKHLVMLPVCALFFFIGAVTVQAATYYVATTGLNSNPGTSGSPFLTIQKCIDVMVAGDTCTVADGTYTDSDGNGIVGYIRSPNADGTAAAPITLKSTNPLGAHVILPSINGVDSAFRLGRAYWIIDGFDISGGANNGLNASHAGISISGATGSVVRHNKFHDIARTVCSNSDFGNAGIYMEYSTDITIVDNLFYAIGRLRNGENGCSTTMGLNDHGIYIHGTANTTIRRNVIYDTNRGFPIHVYGGTATNLSIYHNTISGKSPTGSPVGQIMLASTITTANIKNNISYNAELGMIHYFSLTASDITASYNLSNTLDGTGSHAGVTFSNNLKNTSPDFVDAAGKDFHLNAGSAAINAGTNVGLQFQGAAPDIGAYEFTGQAADTVSPLSPVGLRLQ